MTTARRKTAWMIAASALIVFLPLVTAIAIPSITARPAAWLVLNDDSSAPDWRWISPHIASKHAQAFVGYGIGFRAAEIRHFDERAEAATGCSFVTQLGWPQPCLQTQSTTIGQCLAADMARENIAQRGLLPARVLVEAWLFDSLGCAAIILSFLALFKIVVHRGHAAPLLAIGIAFWATILIAWGVHWFGSETQRSNLDSLMGWPASCFEMRLAILPDDPDRLAKMFNADVRWGGLLLNWTVFSIILVGVPKLLGYTRQTWRRRRDRCMQCGYPRGRTSTCSECGAALPSRDAGGRSA